VPLRLQHLILGSLALAALTLLYPSSPTYDPWAWIVWGREVLHLDLSTVDGPSWKPLPVLFTTPFALFGDAAPALWLVVARAGAICAIVMAFVVARRLGGIIAGAGAAGALVLAPWFLRNAALGNSEGLMAACVLAAVDRHLAGSSRQAFGWGVAAALMRPEAWPFLGLYAAWLLYRERRAVLPLVSIGIGCLPLLWFLPEYWGSGNLSRASDRAQQPLSNSAAFSDDPIVKVFENAAKLMTIPAWVGVALLVGAVVLKLVPRERALPVIGLAILALAWVAEVALMTKHGFSGNQRYLIVPAVLALVVGASGLGLVVEHVATRVDATVAAALVAVVFVVPSVSKLSPLLHSLHYQGMLSHRLADAVKAAGGRGRLNACGHPYTGPFLVPNVAWELHVHTSHVGLIPRAPAVVFRVKTNARARVVPSIRTLAPHTTQTLASATGWRIVAVCG
jgi:hypothetical protein